MDDGGGPEHVTAAQRPAATIGPSGVPFPG